MNSDQNSEKTCDSDTDFLAKHFVDDKLNLLMIRHGQAGGNGTVKGFLGPALSKTGSQQIKLLARRLAELPIDHMYTSDMARAHQTASAVHACHPNTPFRSLPKIREISGFQVRGRSQARTADERKRLHDERKRVAEFADQLHQTHQCGQTIAVIAHNGVNGMLLAELTGIQYRQSIFFHSSHTGITIANLPQDSPAVSLRLMGCVKHLPTHLITSTNIKN